MNNRSIHFLLVATTVFSSGIFVSSSPADAHSFDECVTVQQEIAEEIVNGATNEEIDDGTIERPTKRQLRKKYKQAFKVYAKTCDDDLEAKGFITIKELKRGFKKKNREATAQLILNGRNTELDLDPAAVQADQTAASVLNAEAGQVRQAICAAVTEDEASACVSPDRPNEDSNGDGINDYDEAP